VIGIANPMTLATIKKRKKEIETISKKLNFPILNGAEVDIKLNGELAATKDMLDELDLVIASIHQGFKQSKEAQTNRILKAMENRHVNIIGHPTGRFIGERPGYELDFEKVFKAAKENNVFIEINAHPKRLDMNDVNARSAKEAGLMIPVNTDAHSVNNLNLMEYGVSTARRAWCTKSDILNALSLNELLKRIKR
jgi:DNA polymerase (family 10)